MAPKLEKDAPASRDPLPPLTEAKRRRLQISIGAYSVASLAAFAASASSGLDAIELIAGVLFAGCAGGAAFEYNRRT